MTKPTPQKENPQKIDDIINAVQIRLKRALS